MAKEKNLIGKEILNYRIVRFIGSGGMGSVYEAENKNINQRVAIKSLNANFAENTIVRQKFVSEAKTLLALDHQNIVHFLNFVEDEDGLFLIMEYVDGITLDNFINKKNGLIVETKAYEMFNQILNAFEYAHKHGVVHRDIKPANIMLTGDAEGNFIIKVFDFGIARIVSESDDEEKGVVVGTPVYMSPEQVHGEDIDKRSDIYSLGVLLHQMLTGHAPYDATTLTEPEIQQKVVTEPLPRMRDSYQYVSDRMQKVVDKATAKSPAQRYQDCDSLRKDFLPKAQRPLWIKIAAVAVLILLLGGGFWFWDYNHIKINYYKDYVEQWGVPKGIGKADYKHRVESYKFEKLKGKIVKVSHVNSKGNVAPHTDSEHMERIVNAVYHYTADGKINYVEVMDRNNTILYKKVYDENQKTVIFKYADEFGAEMCLRASTTKLFVNPFDNTQEEKGRISRYLLTYDENGFVARLQYAGFQNVLVSDADGLFGKEYVVDKKGRVIEERFLGHDGTPKANKAGLAIKKFEFDENDNWTKVSYFAPNGELSSDGNGCPVVILDNDKWGNRIKETYYDGEDNLALRTDVNIAGFSYVISDEGYRINLSAFGIDGEPCYLGDYGYHATTHEYDENGYESKVYYKDMEGNLAETSSGCAVIQSKNDKYGNTLEQTFYDINNEPFETPTGFFKWVAEYDAAGNQISLFFYDTNDSLCNISGEYAGSRSVFNDKNMLIEYTYYDTDNQPQEVNGVYTIKYEYDLRGNEIRRDFCAADGKTLVLNNRGVAGWESKYDENGNKIEGFYFDLNRKHTSGSYDYAGWVNTFNADGYIVEIKNFDQNGHLVFIESDGYAGIKYKRDERGNITEKYPYRADGRLAGKYFERRKYDNRDNIIERSFFDDKGNKVLHEEGYHRLVSTYNSRNQEMEASAYGINDQRVINSDGYSIVRVKYDNRGNIIEYATYNTNEQLVGAKYAVRNIQYDAMNRTERETYFDANGNPTNPATRIPEIIYKYDKWGNQNYVAYADGDGNLINHPHKGYAVTKWVYDIKGNTLEIAVFNKNDEPCIDKEDDSHKITYVYNKQNKKTEIRYFLTDGTLRKSDYAILRYTYNEQGKRVELAKFNYLDKAADSYGWQRNVISYDDAGNQQYLRYYTANNKLVETQKWNPRTGEWDLVDNATPTTTTNTTTTTPKNSQSSSNWQAPWQELADECPLKATDLVEIASVKVYSNSCTISLRLYEVSKYNISESDIDLLKSQVKEAVQTFKKEYKTPNNIPVTGIALDKAHRELFRLTY